MGDKTSISWTDATWNPIRGCSRVSEGCRNSYEEHLLDPLRWKKPRRIFVYSMSDLFHENVTDEMRDQIFAVIFSTESNGTSSPYSASRNSHLNSHRPLLGRIQNDD